MKPIFKRILCVTLPVMMVMTMLTGCPPTNTKEFRCEELMDFYEEKGYSATHTEYPEPEDGCGCTVEIQEEDDKYILFRFYDSPNKAQDYADARQLPLLVRIICSLFGVEPSRIAGSHWQVAYEYNSQTLGDLFDQFTNIPSYVRERFFSQEYLENLHLADIPVPKLENGRLIGSYYNDAAWAYYGNLTREEFDAYVLSVVDYLKAREDIYYPSYYYSHRVELGIRHVDDYTNFGETFDPSGNQHSFAFSMEPELDGTELIDPIVIEIVWEEKDWGDMGFTSNTTIRCRGNLINITYEPCAAEHSYDEGIVYPVPGQDRGITVYQCIHCGDTKQSEYLDSQKSYSVTVAKGRNYILSNNWNQTVSWDIDSLHAGQLLEFRLRRPAGGSLSVTVNGEPLTLLSESESGLIYGFIMPEADVTIEIQTQTEQTG